MRERALQAAAMTNATQRPPVDARIVRGAIRGYPLITRAALNATGIARGSLRRRVADGRLRPLLPSVFLIGPDIPTFDTLCMAAVLEGGPGAALFGTTALSQFGAWDLHRHDGSVHVSTSRAVRHRPALAVHFHRCQRRAPLVQASGGIPSSAPLDACVQAGTQLSPHQLANAIRALAYVERIAIDEFGAGLTTDDGRAGVVTLRSALDLVRGGSAGTKSRSEDRALPALAGRFGEPLVNVMGAAELPDYEPDFLWRRERVIVEVDGRHHLEDPVTRRRDASRDDQLTADGWIVVRVPYRKVWRDMHGVLSKLDDVFAARR